MATCRACGGDIRWVDNPDPTAEQKRVPLDTHEAMRGEHRYVEREGQLKPVAESADVAAYSDHRYTCPHSDLNRNRV